MLNVNELLYNSIIKKKKRKIYINVKREKEKEMKSINVIEICIFPPDR